MTGGPGANERAWSADERDAGAGQRDLLSDERDRAADTRDAAADTRDRLADEREAELDEREAQLEARDAGPDPVAIRSREERENARAQREEAQRTWQRRREDRDTAASARDHAWQRRTGAFPMLDERAEAAMAAHQGEGADDGDWVWEADKRDFVADQREYLADVRDAAADAREATADAREQLADDREAELDDWEALLDAREAGTESALARVLEARNRARAGREEARAERERRQAVRNAAAAARGEANRLRTGGTPATGLARAFAEIARHLYDAVNLDDVLVRIVGVSVSAVPGCEMASITVRGDDGSFRTVASTDDAAAAVDQTQYEASEGPCLSAVDEAVVHTPVFPDPRWPALGARPAEAGVRSSVSYSLTPSGPVTEADLAGSLNAYAGADRAFGDEAVDIGLILAAHASVAVRAVGERDTLEQLGRQLHAALASRDVIGQAKGILMERLRITPEDAFDTLRRSSQRLNVKLREVAQKLAETGQLVDEPDHG